MHNMTLLAQERLLKPLLMVAALLGIANDAIAQNFVMTEISDDIHLVKGPAGNTLVAADPDGLILIDGVPEQYAGEYLELVRDATGIEVINTLVLSHWHPEVTGLNGLLGDEVEIVAHENTRLWLGTTIRERGEKILHTPVPEKQLPTRTFYWGSLEIPFKNDVLEVGYLLQSHTDGDVYALFRDANVLYTGPAVRADSWAVVDENSNGFIGGITDAYDTLGSIINEQSVIVPASGNVLNKNEFDALDNMYQSLKAEMVSLLRQSRGPEEVVIVNPAQGLQPEWGDPSEFLDKGFRSFYGHLRNGRQIGGGFP